MDNPGLSLFQDSNTAHINSPQPEELEAIEDEERRNKELQDLLMNAFDDLDEEQTMDQASQLSLNSNCGNGFYSHNNKLMNNEQYNRQNNVMKGNSDHAENNLYRQTEYQSMEQLQILYQVRLREIDRLHTQISEMEDQHKKEQQELTRNVKLMETEKERASIARTETHNLLIESKSREAKLENEVSILQKNFAESEKIKIEALRNIEAYEIRIRNLEQQLMFYERNNKNTDNDIDNIIQEVNHKHKIEICNLQKQVDDYSKKLHEKEKEYDKIDKRLTELQRSHESMMIEKSETINKLMSNLQESQTQCQKFVDIKQENTKLLNSVEKIRQENEELNTNIKSLKIECDMLRYDLHQYESIILKNGLNINGDRNEVNSGKEENGNLLKLQNELKDLTSKLKDKSDEVEKLREKLQNNTKIMIELQKKENQYLNEIQNFKKERDSRNSFEKLLKDRQVENENLEKELKEKEIIYEKEKRKAIDEYTEACNNLNREKLTQVKKELMQEMNEKIRKLEMDLEDSLKENEEVKRRFIEVNVIKDKLQKQNEKDQNRINDLEHQVMSLEEKIKILATEKEELAIGMEKLKHNLANYEDKGNYDELLKKYEILKSESADKQTRLLQLQEQIKIKYSESYEKILKEVVAKEKEFADKFKRMSQNYDVEIKRLQNEIKMWEKKVEEKEEELKESTRKLAEYVVDSEDCRYEYNSKRFEKVRAECDKKIAQVKENQKKILMEVEATIKENVLQIFNEEVDRLTGLFSSYIDEISQYVEELKYKMNDKEKQIEFLKTKLKQLAKKEEQITREENSSELNRMRILLEETYKERDAILKEWKTEATALNEKRADLCAELQKIYDKYRQSRKVALYYKTLVENRNQELKNEKIKNMDTLTKIQKKIDDAVNSEELNDVENIDFIKSKHFV